MVLVATAVARRRSLDSVTGDALEPPDIVTEPTLAAQAVRESMRQVSLAAAALVLPEPATGQGRELTWPNPGLRREPT